jgi:hypothetical protein
MARNGSKPTGFASPTGRPQRRRREDIAARMRCGKQRLNGKDDRRLMRNKPTFIHTTSMRG